MKPTTLCLVLALAAALPLASAAQVAPPGVMNYQGVLRDAGGAPLTGAYDMTFRIFDAASAGNEVIVDTHAAAGTGAVTVTGGLFNVEVGSGALADGSGPGTYTALAPVFASTTDLYLEVQVGAETLSPRIHFASAGMALNAATAVTASTAYDAQNLGGFAASMYTKGASDETLTGNWLNTTNPWADNEVSDTLTVGSGSTITLATIASTVDGRISWDASGDDIVVGNGISPVYFYGGPHAGAVTDGGAATTAAAFAADPADCGAGMVARGISANGTAVCVADDDQPDSDAEVPDAITVSGGTITSATAITLEQGVVPSVTTEGRIQWDTDDDALVVGTGAGTATFRSATASDSRYLRKDTADTAAGAITFTAVPSGSGVTQGTVVVNATSAGADSTLIGAATSGAERFRVDAEGDARFSGDVAAGTSTTGRESFRFYKSGTGGTALYGLSGSVVHSDAGSAGLVYGANIGAVGNGGAGSSVIGLSGTAVGTATSGYRTGLSGSATGGGLSNRGVTGSTNDQGALVSTAYGVSGTTNSSYSGGAGSLAYGVFGSATGASATSTQYGVYGTASGGGTNWGLYTPDAAYVGGKLSAPGGANLNGGTAAAANTLDFGAGASDDLTATDVTDLTDGGTTALHAHAAGDATTLDGLNSTSFLRSDAPDTASGDITFSSGHIAVGTTTNGYVAINSALTLDTTANSAAHQGLFTNSSTTATSGTNAWGGFFSSTGSGTGSSVNVVGLQGTGTGATDSDGVHTGVYGVAAGGNGNHFGVRGAASQSSTSGVHYGVYGTASGGTTNWGLYTPNNTFVGGTLTSGHLGVGVDPDADRAGNFSITGNVNGLLAAVYGSSTSQYTGGTGRATGGFFEGISSASSLTQESDGVYATATGPSGSTGSRYGVRAWAYGGNGVSVGVLGSAGYSLFPDSGTHYGLYGSAAGGATNWGLYTPDNANLGDATTDTHVFWGTLKSGSASDSHNISPYSANWGYVGMPTSYWFRMYANTYYGKNTAIQAFDIYQDLDLLDAMEMVEYTDPKTGRTSLIFSPETLPPMIKGDPSVDGAGADQFVDFSKAIGFAFGSFRQMRAEVRTGLTGVQAQIEARTADPLTGNQSVAGNLSLQLDRDANDRARFSVFKDGGTAVAQELMRLDEEGNLHLKGALKPSALDLAEYHPLAGPATAGDVLVADRSRVGFMKRCDLASDKAVVGIVSTEPGVVLGSGLQRIAAADSEMAEALDQARLRSDAAEEALLWAELERRFSAGHVAIALSGTVPCKVDAAYGPIEVGDLLVASPTPGHAMRSEDPKPGTVVAKALEPLSAGTGLIRVIVMLR